MLKNLLLPIIASLMTNMVEDFHLFVEDSEHNYNVNVAPNDEGMIEVWGYVKGKTMKTFCYAGPNNVDSVKLLLKQADKLVDVGGKGVVFDMMTKKEVKWFIANRNDKVIAS